MQLNTIFLILALGALTIIGGCAQPRASSPASGQASGSASTAESPMRTVAGASGESQAANNRTTQKVDELVGDPNRYRSPPGYPACRYFDGFKDNGDGTVTDPRDGLIWKRCAEGQTWTGTTCSGSGLMVDWFEAMRVAKASRYLNKSDWRLPTKDEFSKIADDQEKCESPGDRGLGIVSLSLGYPIAPGDKRFGSKALGTFWSASSATNAETKQACSNWSRNGFASQSDCQKRHPVNTKYVKSFDRGYLLSTYNGYQLDNKLTSVRLVRSGQAGISNEFSKEYAEIESQNKISQDGVEADRKRRQETERAAAKEAQRKVDERIKAGCNRFYVGKAVQFKPAGFAYLGQKLNAIVLGFGAGKVTLQIKDSVEYNRIFEAPCTSDQVFTD